MFENTCAGSIVADTVAVADILSISVDPTTGVRRMTAQTLAFVFSGNHLNDNNNVNSGDNQER